MSDRRPIEPGRVVRGRIRPPGSKSQANRLLVLAASAGGRSVVAGLSDGDDVRRMIEGLRALGVGIERRDDVAEVEGLGRGPDRDVTIDAGASGTTMRFLTGFAAAGTGRVVLDGTARMRERPLGPLLDACEALGAEVEPLGEPGHPPVAVRGPLRGGDVAIDATTSSQFLSALLLAAPLARSTVTVHASGPVASGTYVEATLEALDWFGVTVGEVDGGWRVPAEPPSGRPVTIEPDASSAVYPWVGAAITGGDVLVEGLDRATSTQGDIGVLDVLEAMGAVVTQESDGIRLRGPAALRAVEADLSGCPDGSLALAVAAAFADGPSRLDGLGTLRVKETDRLAAIEAELRRLGVDAVVDGDSLVVTPAPMHGAVVRTYDDHRMAMAFALAGLVVPGIVIDDPRCVAKTWPGFFEALDAIAHPRVDVIAIDGPAGTGKTTVSQLVAERLGRLRLDTGAFYRAATLVAHREGVPADHLAEHLDDHAFSYDDGAMHLDGEDVSGAIRTPDVTADVSEVSAVSAVRERMVAAQRRWVRSSGTPVVVEGRDIGTVVFPGAVTKVYLTASPEVRARRRAAELGTDPTEEADRIRRRDEFDSGREASPLRPADDAWVLDTSDLTIDEVVDAIVDHHRRNDGAEASPN